MVYKTLLIITIIAILIVAIAYLFLIVALRPSPTGIYHCNCDVPGYGKKEAIVTVQISGETWGAKVLQPTEITLNIFNYSVPCECKTV